MSDNHELFKHIVDGLSVSVAFATIIKWLPPLAAFFSVVWGFARCYEMVTGRKFAESCFAHVIRKIFRAKGPQ